MNKEFIKCRVCDQNLNFDCFSPNRRVCKKCVIKKTTIRNKDYMKDYYKRKKLELNGDDALPAIYKIKCKDPNITEFYVGCTKHLKRREKEHSIVCRGGKNSLKLYEFIRANGNWQNWEMIIIESVQDITTLFDREYSILQQLKPPLNVNGGIFRREP